MMDGMMKGGMILSLSLSLCLALSLSLWSGEWVKYRKIKRGTLAPFPLHLYFAVLFLSSH